jgi:hypothetical protein
VNAYGSTKKAEKSNNICYGAVNVMASTMAWQTRLQKAFIA